MWPLRRRREPELADGQWLVAGLGNPGTKYSRARHNIGFMALEGLAARHGLRFAGSKHRADVAHGTIAGTPVLLALPLTFMNESGNAVSRLLHYYKIPAGRLMVICDDLDLPFGTLRLRPSGTSGGQRGLQSIIQMTGSDEFPRLRLGIGRPSGNAINYVLQPFPPAEAAALPRLISIADDAVEGVLTGDLLGAMNKFNRDWFSEVAVQ